MSAPGVSARQARAGIVVTGTEVLSGRVSDRNGPWLAERLRELGVDLAHMAIVGDRPGDMEAALRFMAEQGVGLILTSGGLGPTADDLTAEQVRTVAVLNRGRSVIHAIQLASLHRSVDQQTLQLLARENHGVCRSIAYPRNNPSDLLSEQRQAIPRSESIPGVCSPPTS